MLKKLEVRNFAVISGLSLELGPGLNVFTGETGAGKSILIEALGFLLGSRGSSTWLRAGADRLSVEGLFEREGGPALVRRELDAGGRARAVIGSQTVSSAALAEWGDALIDFHGQHEHQTLLKPAVQRELLDRFGALEKPLAETAAAHERWTRLCAEKDALSLSDEERARRIDRARRESEEIKDAGLTAGEEEELEAALPLLRSAERLQTLSRGAYEVLYEQEGSVQGLLLKAGRSVSELAKLDPSLRGLEQTLESARLSLEEVTRSVGDYGERVELNPERLDQILSRLDRLSLLKKKYGPTLEAVLEHGERAEAELSSLERSADRTGTLEAELAKAREALEKACAKLHAGRVKAGRSLETAILKELKGLGMAEARFSVAVESEEENFSRHGSDIVDFLIGPNPGEPLRPLRSIASGGELSRVMLAFKTVAAESDPVGILVFDEVDAGIGGAVARTVGHKLAALGRTHQVLCVTHLPQIACFGETHFHVSKSVSGGRTEVKVERLSGPKRLEAIATMLGGREATSASRRHARELLESAA